jgi:hypothetical protein
MKKVELSDLQVWNIYVSLNSNDFGLRSIPKMKFELRHLLSKISNEIENTFKACEETMKQARQEFSDIKKDALNRDVELMSPENIVKFEEKINELFKNSKKEYSISLVPFSLLKELEISGFQEDSLGEIIDFNS